MELDSYVQLYQKRVGTTDFPPYEPAAFRELLRDNDTFLLPEIVPGSGQFKSAHAGIHEGGTFHSWQAMTNTAGSLPALFQHNERLWAAIDISLVIQTLVALERAGLKKGMRVFTEGGFRQNKGYLTLLAAALPDNPVYLTSMKEATSFGAAMTAIMAWTGTATVPPESVNIEYQEIAREDFPDFNTYKEQWLALANK
jgi:sugar (pentulose or hexulose) kinase